MRECFCAALKKNVSRNLIYENWRDKDKKLLRKRIWIPSIVEYIYIQFGTSFACCLCRFAIVIAGINIVAVDIVIIDTVAVVTRTLQNILLFCGQIKTHTHTRALRYVRNGKQWVLHPIFPWQTMITQWRWWRCLWW